MSRRRRAAEVVEGGEHPQRLLDQAGDHLGVVLDELALVRVLEERAHARAVGRLGRVVSGRHEEEEAHHDLVLVEALAVELGVDQHARQVVGGVLAARLDQLLAALEDLGNVALHDRVGAAGVDVLVARRDHGVHEARPDRVVLFVDAHEAADHARDDRLSDRFDEVDLLSRLEAVEHPDA